MWYVGYSYRWCHFNYSDPATSIGGVPNKLISRPEGGFTLDPRSADKELKAMTPEK